MYQWDGIHFPGMMLDLMLGCGTSQVAGPNILISLLPPFDKGQERTVLSNATRQ